MMQRWATEQWVTSPDDYQAKPPKLYQPTYGDFPPGVLFGGPHPLGQPWNRLAFWEELLNHDITHPPGV